MSERTLVNSRLSSRGVDRGFRGFDGGLRRQLRLDVVVQLALRNRPLLGQRRVALDVPLGSAELRLRLGELASACARAT